MYPQTEDEIRRTNIFLAVLYGGLLILAYWGGTQLSSFIFRQFLSSFTPAMENAFREPWAAISMQDSLYLAESNLGNLPPEKLPKGANRMVSLWKWDGIAWNKAADIENLDGLFTVGDRLVGVRDGRLIPFKGLVPGEPAAYQFPKHYKVTACSDSLAILSSWCSNPYQYQYPGFAGDPKTIECNDSLRFERLDSDLKSIEEGSFHNDQALNLYAESKQIIELACLGETVYVFWTPFKYDPEHNRIKPDLLYAPINKEGLAEQNLFPYDVMSYHIFRSPSRMVLVTRKPAFSEKNGRSPNLQVAELIDGKWVDLPNLEIPSMSGFGLNLVDYRGNLHAFYSGFRGVGWQELSGQQWRDRSQEVHGAGQGIQGMSVKLMKLMPLAWGITIGFYAIVMIMAHFHFRAKKNPQIATGAWQGELAPIFHRSAAYAIDRVLVDTPRLGFLVFMFLKFEDVMARPLFGVLTIWLWVLGAWLLPIIYFVICENKWGKTLGKKIMGLRVVTVEGRPPGFWAVFLRNILRIVDDILVYIPVVASVAATQKYQRIGDLAGKTMVVKEPWLRVKSSPAIWRPSVIAQAPPVQPRAEASKPGPARSLTKPDVKL